MVKLCNTIYNNV